MYSKKDNDILTKKYSLANTATTKGKLEIFFMTIRFKEFKLFIINKTYISSF